MHCNTFRSRVSVWRRPTTARCVPARAAAKASAADATTASGSEPHSATRRASLAALMTLPVAATAMAIPCAAEAALELEQYEDAKDAFSISVPVGWTLAMPAESTDRFRAGVSSVRTLSWFPESGTSANVTMVINTPGADYTSLASFGTAQDFGENLVTSMDRSFAAKRSKDPVMVAKLVKTAAADSSYFTEYTIKRGDEEQKHLWSRVALGTNGRIRRFYTVTAQCPEGQRAELGAALEKAVASLKFTA